MPTGQYLRGIKLAIISLLFCSAVQAQVSQKPLPGQDLNNVWTGTNAFKNVNTIQYADQFSGADCGAKINAADTALGSLAGEIWVNQNAGLICSTAVSISHDHVLRFIQGGTYTFPNGLTLSNNSKLIGTDFDPPSTTLHNGINSGWLSVTDNKVVLKFSAPFVLDSLQSVVIEGIQFDFGGAAGATDGVVLKGVTNLYMHKFSIYDSNVISSGKALQVLGSGTSQTIGSEHLIFADYLIGTFSGSDIVVDTGATSTAVVTSFAFYNGWVAGAPPATNAMIILNKNCDGGFWYNTTLTAIQNGQNAILVNGTGTPLSDVDADGNQFYGLVLQPAVPGSYVGPLLQINQSQGQVFSGVDMTGGLAGPVQSKILGTQGTPNFRIDYVSNFSQPTLSNAVINSGVFNNSANGALCTSALVGDICAARSSQLGVYFFGTLGANIFANGTVPTEFTLVGSSNNGAVLSQTEGALAIGNAGQDNLWADSTAHRWKAANNNGAAVTFAYTDLAQTWTAGQTLGAGSSLNLNSLLISPTVPTIAAGGCGGSAAAIQNANGTASFNIFTGTAPTSGGCTITMPAAATDWHCEANHTSAISTTNFIIQQTGALSTTSVNLTLFSDVAAATAPAASDTWRTTCTAN